MRALLSWPWLVVAGLGVACNTYTPDLLKSRMTNGPSAGAAGREASGLGGQPSTGGRWSGDTGGGQTGGTGGNPTSTSGAAGRDGSGGVEPTGGSAGSDPSGGLAGSGTTSGAAGGTGGTEQPGTGGTPPSSGGAPDTGGAGGESTGGSATGGSATGGVPPTGGAAGDAGSVGTGGEVSGLLIDDFEDGDNRILITQERNGFWYTVADQSVVPGGVPDLVPAPGDAVNPGAPGHASNYALNVHGTTGFNSWGAGFGFAFRQSSGPYDLSGYSSASFFIKAGDGWTGGDQTVKFMVPTDATSDSLGGGSCVAGYRPCGDSHFAWITVTDVWTEVSVALDANTLRQEGWGVAASFDISTVLGFQIRSQTGQAFDVWIDDITLVE